MNDFMKTTIVVAGACAAGVCFGGGLQAQELPLGGRTASMGGAAMAQGRDSAMPVLNPAGLARVPHDTLMLSASLYTWTSYEVDDFFVPAGLDPALSDRVTVTKPADSLTASGFASFPGSAAMLFHLGGEQGEVGHQVVGLSITVPRFEKLAFKGEFALSFGDGDAGTTRDTLTSVREKTDWLFGPSYAIDLGMLKLGVSGLFKYTSFSSSDRSETLNVLEEVGGTSFSTLTTSSFSKGSRLSLEPVLGTQADLGGGLSVGASATLPSVALRSSTESTFTSEINATDGDQLQTSVATGTGEDRTPLTLRAGLAYGRPQAWTVALDVGVSFALEEAATFESTQNTTVVTQNAPRDVREVTSTTTYDKATAYDLKLGAEYYVTPFVAVRGGVFYLPNPLELEEILEHQDTFDLDLIGFSLGLGLGNEAVSTDLGVSVSFGQGEVIAGDAWSEVGQLNVARVDANYTSVVFFLSGSVDFAEMSAALDKDLGGAL